MKCPKCQANNSEGLNFCEECGERLEMACPSCGHAIAPGKKFCGKCGKALTQTVATPQVDYSKPQSYTPKFLAEKILTTRSSIEGERKLVTVLFADVANYTAMAERLDPEEIHGIMDGCFRILMDEVHRYEGTINQFTGDGVMALFGAPVGHEDHAQRASYAALAIQKGMKEYGEKLEKEFAVEFKMRIGLNSGPVIVGSIGDDLRMDYTTVGDTTNIAARVQQAAKAGEVWISQETRAAVRGYFIEEPVGKWPLKGKSQPQALYRLLAERPEVRTRFEAGLVRGVTEFVGRRPELEALQTAFAKAESGEAQVVDVVGEAGVGKSRLIHEFQKSLDSKATFLTGISIQHGRNINFLPVIQLVKSVLDIAEGMNEEEVGYRIEENVKGEPAAMIPFLKNLLSLKVDDGKFKTLNPEGRKYGTFEALKSLLLALSQEKTLVLFLEDIHWMDKISEEFFTYLSRCLHGHKVLMISAYRPESSPPWAQGAHYQRLGLETLSTGSSIRLVRNMLGGLTLEPALEQRIVEKTGGNPFFMEEIVRDLLDRGELVKESDRYICRRPIDQCEIPNTVQGVIAARMDRLSEDLKQTMQVASVIGRDFAFRILKSIMELGDELRIRLTNLVGLEILYEKVLYPELEYIFKHALTQEVAYESLLKQRRREIHGRIARAIEEQYPDRLEQHFELLAHHYELSGDISKAIEYLISAGEKSNKNYAVQSAYEFFTKVLELSKSANVSLDPKTEAKVCYQMARAAYEIGYIDLAIVGHRKSEELCREHGMVDLEMINLSRQATVMAIGLRKEEEARTFFERGITRAKELSQTETESIVLANKGFWECAAGNIYQGYDITVEAEEKALQTQNSLAIFNTRLIRAHVERILGRPGKTVELTEGLFQPLRKTLNINGLASTIFVRGLGLAEAGRLKEAMSHFQEGIDICEKFGVSLWLARLYNCLGYCYGEIYNTKPALKLNLRSEEISRKFLELNPKNLNVAGEKIGMAKVNIMENLYDQMDSKGAWDLIESFSRETKSWDFQWSHVLVEKRMEALTAQILLQRHDIGLAETIVLRNLEFTKREHVKKYEGRFLRLLGQVQMKRHEPDNAIANMGEAVKILKEVGNPRQLWQAQASLASALDQTGRLSEAREQWGAAAEVINNLANNLSDRELRRGFLEAVPIREILSKKS